MRAFHRSGPGGWGSVLCIYPSKRMEVYMSCAFPNDSFPDLSILQLDFCGEMNVR